MFNAKQARMRLHGFGPTVDLTTECGIRDGVAPDSNALAGRLRGHMPSALRALQRGGAQAVLAQAHHETAHEPRYLRLLRSWNRLAASRRARAARPQIVKSRGGGFLPRL